MTTCEQIEAIGEGVALGVAVLVLRYRILPPLGHRIGRLWRRWQFRRWRRQRLRLRTHQ